MPEDLVGFLLVARQFDRDVRRATRDGRLDALLVFAVAQLHQRLVVETQPWDVACFGGPYQRRGRRTERAPLRKADELVASFRPVPALGHAAGGSNRIGKQRAQQAQAEFARRNAFVTLRVFVHDRVNARCFGAAGLAERDALAGDVLQLDRDVFEHVAEPRAVVLAHAPEKPAGLAIRAAVFLQARKGRGETVDERRAEPAGRPFLEFAEVEVELDDGEMRIERRSDVHGTIEDPHDFLPLPAGLVPRLIMAQPGLRALRARVPGAVIPCAGRVLRRTPRGCAY